MNPSTRYNFNLNSFQMEEKTWPIQILPRFWSDTKILALNEAMGELTRKNRNLKRELKELEYTMRYVYHQIQIEQIKNEN